MKEIIRELITEFHKESLPQIIKRNIEVPILPPSVRKALVFIGMRRAGKTWLMYQHMQYELTQGLNKNKMIYINFEDDRLDSFVVKDFQTILDVYFELYPAYANVSDLKFYFDEIQNIDGWEKFIRRLIDKEKMAIYITGSSAKSLSKEIATSLRGRCLTQEVFPLSFLEYLNYQGIKNLKHLTSKDKSAIRHHCQHYLVRGGFPETLALSDHLHRETIQSYINTAVFRDVIDRHQLSNPHIVKLFLVHCLQNIATSLSITKVYNTFKSRGETVGRTSLYSYFDYFEDAYLLCSVPLFELSTRKRQVNPNKIYCIDTGIIGAYSIKPQMELSARLENAVYIFLKNKQYDAIYYHKTTSGKEVDFVAQQLNGKIDLFQVCVDLKDEKTKQREISSLIEAADEFEVKQAWIITSDTFETFITKTLTIHIIPYWQWVLED